jgi:hypothetical protein
MQRVVKPVFVLKKTLTVIIIGQYALAHAAHITPCAKGAPFALQHDAGDVRAIGPLPQLCLRRSHHIQCQGIECLWQIQGNPANRKIILRLLFVCCDHGNLSWFVVGSSPRGQLQ